MQAESMLRPLTGVRNSDAAPRADVATTVPMSSPSLVTRFFRRRPSRRCLSFCARVGRSCGRAVVPLCEPRERCASIMWRTSCRAALALSRVYGEPLRRLMNWAIAFFLSRRVARSASCAGGSKCSWNAVCSCMSATVLNAGERNDQSPVPCAKRHTLPFASTASTSPRSSRPTTRNSVGN